MAVESKQDACMHLVKTLTSEGDSILDIRSSDGLVMSAAMREGRNAIWQCPAPPEELDSLRNELILQLSEDKDRQLEDDEHNE